MRYVLFNWLSPSDVGIWESWSAEEQAADVDRHRQWFARHREHIVSGEELDEPLRAKTLRPGRQGEGVVVTDGPFLETKEILGGFVVIEAADMDEAVDIASDWPSLSTMPNGRVQLHPVYQRD